MADPKFSVAVLCYGDYPKLARRCLDGIRRTLDRRLVADVRIGLNDASAETKKVVDAFAAGLAVPCHVYREPNDKNVFKYPLMRRMFYDAERPLVERVMWFDDDSYVVGGKEVWRAAANAFTWDTDVVGSLWRPAYAWTPAEKDAIAAQPWYSGRNLEPGPIFCTGGWWAADTAFLAKWDYPFKALRHNGGDVLLGELCRQQQRKPKQHTLGVAINADHTGRNSSSPRRGVTTARAFERPAEYDHHDFAVAVHTWQNSAEPR